MRLSRFFIAKLTLILATVSGIALSLPLFLATREYPLVPLIPNLTVPESFHVMLLCLFLLSIGGVFFSGKKVFLVSATILLGIIFILDQSRLQPWIYQYGWMLIILCVTSFNTETQENRTLGLFQFILITTYIWSGFQKLNVSFIESGFPWMISPIIERLPEVLQVPIYSIGVCAPIIEIAIGIGLLFKKTRTIAVISAVMMHLFILFFLGPLGHNTNSVVWPWNIAMIVFVVTLFWRTDKSFKDSIRIPDTLLQKLVLIFFGILPAFSFINLWDSYLSMSLYSANIERAIISVPTQQLSSAPYTISRYANPGTDNMSIISFDDWSLGEMNVPAYPETRVFKGVLSDLCSKTSTSIPFELTVFEPKVGSTAYFTTSYICSDFRQEG